MKFNERELKEILISTVVLAFAFRNFLPFDAGILGNVTIAFFVVGINFLAHELFGHKLFAQRLGAEAEYRMWPMGLLLALVGSFVGVVFAAPGAVYFNPVVRGPFAFTVHRFTKKDVGLVALAGPAVNMVLGAVFLAVSFYAFQGLFLFAAYISFFMAFFNLLPLPPLDGSKVIAWSLPVWAVSIAIAAVGYLLL